VRVLLISPNRLLVPYPVYPIGLDYVAAALEPRHQVRVLDLCPLASAEVTHAVSATIREFEPEAIGISIRNIDNTDATGLRQFVEDAAALVSTLRQESRAPIVLGGAGFSLYPAEVLAATGADLGFVGEGERAAALFDALASGGDVRAAPGAVGPGWSGPRAAPLPAGDIGRRPVPSSNPALPFYVASCGVMNLQTQRGCPYRCVYCTYPGLEGARARQRSPLEVAREALALQAAGARYLFLVDSVFNGDPAHALAVAAAFQRAGVLIPWGAYFAPLPPPPGFYDRMAAAGCTHVEFGTESLSDPVLQRIRKSFRRSEIFDAHRAARRAGLHVAHFLILGGPDEDERTLQQTLSAAEELEDAALFLFCGMRVYRGTELAAMTRRAGQIAEDDELLRAVFYEPPALRLSEIEDRVRARASGHRNWIVGDGGERTRHVTARLYAKGHTGPLWEHLVSA
jgi:radical SAM superfamily enzyme YgiQ (UPF0313 family)